MMSNYGTVNSTSFESNPGHSQLDVSVSVYETSTAETISPSPEVSTNGRVNNRFNMFDNTTLVRSAYDWARNKK